MDENVERLVEIDAVLESVSNTLMLLVTLKNPILTKQKKMPLSITKLTDANYMSMVMAKEVFYIRQLSDSWSEKIITLIQINLETDLPVFNKIEKIGKQEGSQTWVFSEDIQFHSNGTLVPRDMINSHWTDQSIVSPPLKNVWYTDILKYSNTTNFSLRTYLKCLRAATGRENQQGATCLFAAYLLQFHQDISDSVGLSIGLISRPVYTIDLSSHGGRIALRTLSALTNNYTYLSGNPTAKEIETLARKCSMPLLLEIENLTEETITFIVQLAGNINLPGQGIILATKHQIDPENDAFREITFPSSKIAPYPSPDYQQITFRWENAYFELPNIIKFGTNLKSPSFRNSCQKWLNTLLNIQSMENKRQYVQKVNRLSYNSIVQLAMLGGTYELLGNLHGDWTYEDCLSFVIQAWPDRSDDVSLQYTDKLSARKIALLANRTKEEAKVIGTQKRALLAPAANDAGSPAKVSKDSQGKVIFLRPAPLTRQVTVQTTTAQKISPSSTTEVSSTSGNDLTDISTSQAIDRLQQQINRQNEKTTAPLNEFSPSSISSLISSSISLLKGTVKSENMILNATSNTSNADSLECSPKDSHSQNGTTHTVIIKDDKGKYIPATVTESDCGEQKKRIINSVITHFIENIPAGRDPKDFIRSAYRTRDSSEIYVALRLPVLRKLLDVNTRKAFRDILDLHGGQRQQTRFGSDSTSAQLIPRILCSKENLDRIEDLMRSRIEQKRLFPQRILPMHSGLSLLDSNYGNETYQTDNGVLRLQDIIGENMEETLMIDEVSEGCTEKVVKIEASDQLLDSSNL